MTVFSIRTAVKVMRMSRPVSGAKDTGTSTTDPATRPSATGGRVTCSVVPPALTDRAVGTECSPSATICRSRWSKVTGAGRSYSSHCPAWWEEPNPGSQMVDELPSRVWMAPALRSPGSRPWE